MKILVAAPQPFFVERGTPIAVRLTVETMAKLGHEVDLLVYHEGKDVAIDGVRIERISAPPGVRGIPVGPSWKKLVCDAPFAAAMLRLARQRRYDVIHAVEEAAAIAHATRWIHRTPYVVDMDSSIPSQLEETFAWIRPFAAPLRFVERSMLRNAAAVLAVCKELGRIAERAGVRAPIGVVEDAALEDGPDSGAAAEGTLRDELGIAANDPIVLYVGNLQGYQGVDLLVEAFARTKCPGTLVVIGGDPSRISRLREKARSLGIEARTRWPGPRPLAGLGGLLAQADVLVSPRLHGINTPMKIYSYLASARAVLATDIVSHTQVLTPDVAALAPPEPAAFAAALDRLLANADVRVELGARGKDLAEREFSRAAFERKLARFLVDVEKSVGAGRGARGVAREGAV
jgi:glycosyltransferase involved in cell wall biosynthesis